MTDFAPDITPDAIAAIATRLFNEAPGASAVPQTETQIRELPSEAPRLPVGVIPPSDGMFAVPGVSDANPDGLRAFVQRIRTTDHRSETLFRTNGRAHDSIPHSSGGASQGAIPPGGTPGPVDASRPLDIPAIRRDFPALNQHVHGKPLAWLDNAATTQKPQSVIDALSSFYAHDNSNIHRGAHTLAARATDAYEQARQKVQTFLGASSTKEIVFVRGTTEGINLISQTYGRKFLQPGDEIVLSTLEHHANIVPWQFVAREKGPC